MRTQRDYYEILGLAPTATTAEIKRKYRELARKFHPDVTRDKSFGHRTFTQITEAYKTLSDPDLRRAYDASRAAARPSTPPTGNRQTSGYSQSQNRPQGQRPSSPTGRPAQPGWLTRDAEFAFISGRLGQAASLCRQAIRQNRGDARAHAILGDIYRIQGRKEQAIMEYTYAVQFDPSDRTSQAKLEKLLHKATRRVASNAAGRERQQAREDTGPPSAVSVTNMVGWGMAFFTLFLINIYPGAPIPGLKTLLPSISTWSWNLVWLLAIVSALVAFLLAINHLVSDPDEELLFQHLPGSMIPIGFPLLIFSVVFFYATAGVYLLISLLQGSFSKSMIRMFLAVTAVTLLAALMYEPGRMQVVMFGGNVAFPAAVVGWYVGRLFGPLDK